MLREDVEEKEREFEIVIPPGLRLGDLVVEARGMRKAFGEKLLFENVEYADAEIPAGWGLLVRSEDSLQLRRKPAALDAGDAQRRALLESIALRASRVASPPPSRRKPDLEV